MSARIVHIVDDEHGIRLTLGMLAESAGFTAMTHASADLFLEAVDLAGAGCVVTDIRMPGASGMELLMALRTRAPDLPVIIMTGHGDVQQAVKALKAGAHDFIEKPVNSDAFTTTIADALNLREAALGERMETEALKARHERLTEREREVMDLIVRGLSNAAAGEVLGISVRTVENHRARVMDKMAAPRLSDLVRMSLKLGED